MLPPVIIEHIKKRELEERRRRDQAAVIQLPLPSHRPAPIPSRSGRSGRSKGQEADEDSNGLIVIDVL